MTNSEFDKVKSFIYSLSFNGIYRFSDGSEIRSRKARYGVEYALYADDGNCVTTEYDIEKFRYIFV